MNNRQIAVKAFCDECVWVRSIRTHFADLFETSDKRNQLLAEIASTFFHDLNLLMIEYLLLQQCKLTDPASSGGTDKNNLTSNYIVGLGWSEETKLILESANTELMAFRIKIFEVRRKLIAHLDFRARTQSNIFGEFTALEEKKFWDSLQVFVNAAHEEAFSDPFEIDVMMVDGDVSSLMHSLAEAADYNDLV
jgi:hypothetical protein